MLVMVVGVRGRVIFFLLEGGEAWRMKQTHLLSHTRMHVRSHVTRTLTCKFLSLRHGNCGDTVRFPEVVVRVRGFLGKLIDGAGCYMTQTLLYT